MSMMVSFCAVLFPRDVLDEILNLIESVSEGFPTYFYLYNLMSHFNIYTKLTQINVIQVYIEKTKKQMGLYRKEHKQKTVF